MKLNIAKYDDYQNNQELVGEIMKMILPSYKNAGSHIAKDIAICNQLYIVNSEDHQMLAFFMVGYHKINDLDCCYLGLSACRQEYKNNGFVKALFFEFARDCIRKELSLNKRILCYWTTATPIVYHWFCKYFSDVAPDRQGNCSTGSKRLLTLIARSKYKNASFEADYPFILRQAAHQINYSDAENDRIRQAIIDLNLAVFENHRLDETNGDRFLMVGYAPHHDKLIEYTQSLKH